MIFFSNFCELFLPITYVLVNWTKTSNSKHDIDPSSSISNPSIFVTREHIPNVHHSGFSSGSSSSRKRGKTAFVPHGPSQNKSKTICYNISVGKMDVKGKSEKIYAPMHVLTVTA